jgi:hypothetical protein
LLYRTCYTKLLETQWHKPDLAGVWVFDSLIYYEIPAKSGSVVISPIVTMLGSVEPTFAVVRK